MISREELAKYHRYKDHKNGTKQRIRGALRHWNRLKLDPADPDSFALYRDARLEDGAAPATVKGELNKLIAIARYLGHNPIVKMPRSPQRCPEAWTKAQCRLLFKEARRTDRMIWGMPGRVFWPALLGLTYDSGERIGAVLSLTRADLAQDTRTVLYKAEVRKGGYRDAVAIYSRQTRRDLRQLLLAHNRDEVFLHGDPSTLWKAYTRILADAGLPNCRRSKFHRLRRTHATFVHAAGGDATAALGHSSDAVTRASYIDFRQITRRLPWRPGFWW